MSQFYFDKSYEMVWPNVCMQQKKILTQCDEPKSKACHQLTSKISISCYIDLQLYIKPLICNKKLKQDLGCRNELLKTFVLLIQQQHTLFHDLKWKNGSIKQ